MQDSPNQNHKQNASRCIIYLPYREKKSLGKVTNIFPQLNFNPNLFNPTRIFLLLLKHDKELSAIF